MSNFTPLSRSDLLHRSAKLKSSYVASSLLFSYMKVHEAGIDPIFSDGIVEFFVEYQVKLWTDVSRRKIQYKGNVSRVNWGSSDVRSHSHSLVPFWNKTGTL